MMYKTHTKFGKVSGIFLIILMQNRGIMPHYLLAFPSLIIAMPMAGRGSGIPDSDQRHSKATQSGIEHRILSVIWAIGGVKHRSKTSHTIFNYIFVYMLFMFGYSTIGNYLLDIGYILILLDYVFRLAITAYFTGIISHLISDAFTTRGVFIVPWSDRKLRFTKFTAEFLDKPFYNFSNLLEVVGIVLLVYQSYVISLI